MKGYALLRQRGFLYLAVRIAILAGVLVFYNLVDWKFLVQVLGFSLDKIMDPLGYPSVWYYQNGSLHQVVGGRDFSFNSNCTYIDLALIIAPLCIRFRQNALTNALRVLIITVLILTMNVLRIVTVIILQIEDVPWQLAHDYPDFIIHTVVIATCAILAIREDLAGVLKPRQVSSA